MNTTFWIQLLGTVFGVGMLYFTYVRYKRKELSSLELISWIIGWIILVSVALKPNVLDFMVAPLNFSRRLDFFVVFGFFALLSLSFYNYALMRKIEKKIEKIVSRDAIKEATIKHDHNEHHKNTEKH